MKKTLLLATLIVAVTSMLVIQACQHEIPGDPCTKNPISLSVSKTDATGSANNGTITATASGGTDFRYSLNGGAFQDTGYFSGLAPFQAYNVVVKNGWDCSDTAQVSINVNDPCSGVTIAVSAAKTDASPGTNNGTITVTATGGTGLTYSINGTTFQSSNSFTGLAAGNYTVTVKSSAGCMGTTQVTIGTNNPCAGVTITVTATKVDPTTGQSNGSITASASGSTGFTYSLNNGAFQSSATFTGLATGNYTITAKNANGCTGTTAVALGSTNPCNGVTITVSLAKVDPTSGQSNGSITATASGATGFTYSLNTGAYQASNSFTGLAAGTYTITAKSSAGCLGSAQVTLTAANPCSGTTITLTTAIVNYTPCLSPASGKITVTATGSTGFTFNINGGAYQASNIFSALAAGTFTVGAKDANGCTNTTSAVVASAPAGPMFTQMRNLISSRCSGSGCHMNGGSAAGYNFDQDCSIVTYWTQINKSCVLYTMTKMPKSPQALLTAAEKLVITNWVNAGHKFTD
jgi:hypothetical protein